MGESTDGGAVSILIVDDSSEHCLLLESILHNAGYWNVTTADSVEAAYERLGMQGRTPALHLVDVILMDIMLPGVDGLNACRAITTDPGLSDIPVIVVTALTDADHLRLAFAAGATDYIRKPVVPVEVVARVYNVLTVKVEMAMRKRRERDLEVAMRELKALRGYAPICASCKRIRDVSGRWQSLDEFVKAQSDLQVDDTLCQRCVDEWRREELP